MKSKSIVFVSCLLGTLIVYGVAQAGELEPTGPPAPTMVTLQEIYDRISAGPAGLAKTGQTKCWDVSENLVDCTGTGQDGEFRTGVSTTPRFQDNQDGTATDNLTGLVWLMDTDCLGSTSWTDALSAANTLASGSCSLTDGSVAGDWRLPNVRELHSLIDFGRYVPALPDGYPFSGQLAGYFWTSTSRPNFPHIAWYVNLDNGVVNDGLKTDSLFVWAVRGDQ